MNRRMARVLAAGWLILCPIGNAAAERGGSPDPRSVSVFAATDRHAQYETVVLEEEEEPDAEAGGSPVLPRMIPLPFQVSLRSKEQPDDVSSCSLCNLIVTPP